MAAPKTRNNDSSSEATPDAKHEPEHESKSTKRVQSQKRAQEQRASAKQERFAERERDQVDEASWESFPASDPPATNAGSIGGGGNAPTKT